MSKIFGPLLKNLNKSEYSTDQSIIKSHCVDWRGKYKGTSNLILFPKSVPAIQKIVRFCYKNKIPIVPQGGNTSLVGGSVPRFNKGEIILNLTKLNKIRDIDTTSNTITLESGCILQKASDELHKYGLEMPISLGSKGSCQIGGNIATNAGGLNFIKYGSIRSNVLGIEAVLPNGELYNDLKTIKKNNTGFDLKQLLVGSEGTLGIITAATMKVFKRSEERVVILISVNHFNKILKLYKAFVENFDDLITAFELMNKYSVDLTKKINEEMNLPLKGKYYCLVELTNFLNLKHFNNFIIDKFTSMNINDLDLLIAKSENENQSFWKIREEIPLAEKLLKNVIQHDIALPLNLIEKFIEQSSIKLKKLDSKINIINFGHLGDNNLHFNVSIDKKLNKNDCEELKNKVNKIVFSLVTKFNGSISAEHGIGQLRKNELKIFKSSDEIKIMSNIKSIFDPRNIMNPGKVL